MGRYLRATVIVAVIAVVAAACGGDGGTGTSPTPSGGQIPTGGTLKTVMTQDFFHGLDPTEEYYVLSQEILRCCMARLLLSYNGKPVDEGGTVPRPDLAVDMPTSSDDGLVWTFKIKQGVKFGDPLNREIVAQDFVNSINRLADPETSSFGYPFYYTRIKGFQEKTDGKADEVSGVEAVDDKTFQVTLTEPEPDFLYLFSMEATAPMPTELIESHYKANELGQFLVSSGPYEYEGMEGFDLAGKNPPEGVNIGKSYVFVRNDAWDRSTDDLRKAYVDRIEIQVGGEVQDLLDKVDAGTVDLCLDCLATSATLQRYNNDPELKPRLKIYPADGLAYTGLNVFQAPFDDVHVRKAVNWALDKAAMWRLAGGPASGVIAGHFIPSTMMGGLLADYDPYATEGDRGDPEKAKEEMKQSKYDTNGDGVCDDPSCNVQALTVTNDNDSVKALQIMDQSFSDIGIHLDIKTLDYNALVTKCSTLESHTAFCQAAWVKDFPSPFTFFGPLLDGENGSNYAFTGVTAEQLQAAGYTVPDPIPSIHDQIDECHTKPIDDQAQCWADLDTYVTEELVAVIPRRFVNNIDVLGERIVNYSYDQFLTVGAIDHYALAGGGA